VLFQHILIFIVMVLSTTY